MHFAKPVRLEGCVVHKTLLNGLILLGSGVAP